jgi:3' terminal RNA ribose 2'-O-methyltransferase Hen1
MILSIATTHKPATDLGYLLHKNPATFNTFDVSFGKVHVFYTHATADFCEAVLLVEIDPLDLVKGRADKNDVSGYEYVNDRPYAISSFTSVAISKVLGSALAGKCKGDLANQKIPLIARMDVVPCRSGEKLLRELFEPLGYEVEIQPVPLDLPYLDGESHYYSLELQACCTVKELLTHLYVLIPVLDNQKHYWVEESEIEKLLRHGGEWLKNHPAKGLITSRYLKYQKRLVNKALLRLIGEEIVSDAEESENLEDVLEKKVSLHDIRLDQIVEELQSLEVKSIIDLGCGEGKLLKRLLRHRSFETIAGMDVSLVSLQRAKERLAVESLPEKEAHRLTLFLGALGYRDKRLCGFDAAVASEVIEHLDPCRLEAFAITLFECAKPHHVIITTPNAEYNVEFPNLAPAAFRHPDHRFEWTRAEFQAWAKEICQKHGYSAQFKELGPLHPTHGAPSQMAIFTRVITGGT